MFKVKADDALKGRLEVQDWGQVYGYTYAPVGRIQSIQMAQAITGHED